jgi:hypothetical protein
VITLLSRMNTAELCQRRSGQLRLALKNWTRTSLVTYLDSPLINPLIQSLRTNCHAILALLRLIHQTCLQLNGANPKTSLDDTSRTQLGGRCTKPA